ncbi:MAG: radical SAM protein, partial [Planctomycetes bacterium]|nr:radical SAM protein [Planctomycetota bacterium]
MTVPLSPYRSHSRHWRRNVYVYPVISRRSRGLSLGINLNPDKACNFDCVYCQVDRTTAPTALQAPARRGRRVEVDRVRDELTRLIDDASTGALFTEPPFADVRQEMRAIQDIAFSGDGEPTTCKQFRECVELTAEIKAKAGLSDTKIVLITDACYLTR